MNDQPISRVPEKPELPQQPARYQACRSKADGRVYIIDKATGVMRLAQKREGASDVSKRDRAKMKRALKRSAGDR